MEKYPKVNNEEERIPVWLVTLVVLGVIGVLAVLLISFFGSSL
jgi:hypothetical protein